MDANGTVYSQVGYLQVSIHAPVMDAKSYTKAAVVWFSFNPRARDGRELIPNRTSIIG